MDIDFNDDDAVQRHKRKLMDEVLQAADRFADALKEIRARSDAEHQALLRKPTAVQG
jgi:hypothetical protein